MDLAHPQRILVTGAGGFIGGHLVQRLLQSGHDVRSVDIKPLDDWHQKRFPGSDDHSCDVSLRGGCDIVTRDIDTIYNLAADMGGMGFIENNRAACMVSVLINTNLLLAAKANGVKRYFFSSSACVYSSEKQSREQVQIRGLREDDIYPIAPERGYGEEKLFSERVCQEFRADFGLETRIARYHNAYGPNGTYDGGREKAPAAICRKIIEAKLSGNHEIEIWGNGEQLRSFMYIDDCVEGTIKIANSDYAEPINLGSSEMVSINQLVDIVEDIAGIKCKRNYIAGPLGVQGRSSDNTRIQSLFGWEPSTPLRVGMEKTYAWIYNQMVKK